MNFKQAFLALQELAIKRLDVVSLTVECWIRPAGSGYVALAASQMTRRHSSAELEWQVWSQQASQNFCAPSAAEAIERYRLGVSDETSIEATAANLRLVGDCNVD